MKAKRNRRALIAPLLIVMCLVSQIMTPLGINTAEAQSCRDTTSLNILQILLQIRVTRLTLFDYDIQLTLNTNRHAMLCNSDFYCPGNRDHYAFRAAYSSNIAEVAGGGFDNCNSLWRIKAADANQNIVFNFKTKYQQDFITTGGRYDPRKKNASITIQPNLAVGETADFTSQAVNEPDDGF